MQRLGEIQESPFMLINKLAKEKNKEALDELINTGVCVGAFNKNENNPMLLAYEGDFESVNFLTEHFSASINHGLYGAARGCHTRFIKTIIDAGWPSLNYAAKGMAVCGHIDTLEELIDRGASLHDAVEGAAMGGHIELVFSLIKRGAFIDFAARGAACVDNESFADELLIRGAKLSFAAEGAARGGFIDYCEKLLSRSLTRGHDEWLKVFEGVQRGAAHGGNVLYTKDLIQQSEFINHSLYGAASGGHIGLYNALLNLIPKQNKEYVIGESLKYAAKEGHLFLTLDLYSESRQGGLAASSAIYGAAAGGNLKLAEELLSYHGVDITFAAQGAASGYQAEILNRLTIKKGVSLNLVVEEMADKGYLASKDILRFTSFIDNAELRRLISTRVPESIVGCSSAQLFSRTTKKNELIRKYNLTFYQTQAYLTLMSDSGYSCLLLQAHKFFCDSKFSFNLFLKMVLHLVSKLDRAMNIVDAENIYFVAHRRLRDRVISDSSIGFFSLFKSRVDLEKIEATAKARYKQRVRYI